MSRLSRRKGGSRFGGPITSTQIDGGVGKPEEEYMSREERVFNRQLEAAIELSKKTASEESSESSQESIAKISRNDPAQQVSSEKSSEGDANKSSSKSEETLDLEYQSKPSLGSEKKRKLDDTDDSLDIALKKKPKARKIFDDSDDDSEDEFCGMDVNDDDSDEEFTVTKKKPNKPAPKTKDKKAKEQPTASQIANAVTQDLPPSTSKVLAKEPVKIKLTESPVKRQSRANVLKITDSDDDDDLFDTKLFAKDNPSKIKSSANTKLNKQSPVKKSSTKKSTKARIVSDDDDDDDFAGTKVETVKPKPKQKSPVKKPAKKSKAKKIESDEDDEDDDDFAGANNVENVKPKVQAPPPKAKVTETKKPIPEKSLPTPKPSTPTVADKKPKAKVETKTPVAKSAPVTPKTPTSAFKSPAQVEKKTPSTPSFGSRSSPAFHVPKWNPPAMLGRGQTSKSPATAISSLSINSPGIKVGLSRNAKVKPLHPNAKFVNNN